MSLDVLVITYVRRPLLRANYEVSLLHLASIQLQQSITHAESKSGPFSLKDLSAVNARPEPSTIKHFLSDYQQIFPKHFRRKKGTEEIADKSVFLSGNPTDILRNPKFVLYRALKAVTSHKSLTAVMLLKRV